MRIAIVGGIFDKDSAYRAKVRITPETTLADGLESRGHRVLRLGHSARPASAVEIVHVHHVSADSLRHLCGPGRAMRVLTVHGMAIHGPAHRAALAYGFRRAEAIVPLSRLESGWQRKHGAPADRQREIPNGIDPSIYRFVPPPPPPPTGAPWRVLFVGQLTAAKGAMTLVSAAAAVDRPLHLHFVFHIDDELATVSRLCQRLDVDATFHGRLDPDELAERYADSHLLALPSDSEALPSAVSEALMVGRPVVATPVGAIPSQIGDFGRLVERRSVSSLRDGLTEVIGRYAGLCRRAQAVSAGARERFSVLGAVERHEALYAGLIEHGSPRCMRLVDFPVRAALSARRAIR